MAKSDGARTPWYRVLYVQVLIAVALGALIGALFPAFGKTLKPLGDGFIKLVKMIIAPIIFCTVVHGIASMSDLKKLGRVGGKALLYFEVVSTIALVLGLVVVNLLKPGVGFNIDPATLDPSIGRGYAHAAHSQGITEFLLRIIPNSFFDAFATGDLLQVLLVAVLSAFAISAMGSAGSRSCAGSKPRRRSSSGLCASSSNSRRSLPSARWRSPSAAMASARSTVSSR